MSLSVSPYPESVNRAPKHPNTTSERPSHKASRPNTIRYKRRQCGLHNRRKHFLPARRGWNRLVFLFLSIRTLLFKVQQKAQQGSDKCKDFS